MGFRIIRIILLILNFHCFLLLLFYYDIDDTRTKKALNGKTKIGSPISPILIDCLSRYFKEIELSVLDI